MNVRFVFIVLSLYILPTAIAKDLVVKRSKVAPVNEKTFERLDVKSDDFTIELKNTAGRDGKIVIASKERIVVQSENINNTLGYFQKPRISIPVYIPPNSQLFVDGQESIINVSEISNKWIVFVYMEIESREACKSLLLKEKDLVTEQAKICIAIKKEKLRFVEGNDGAYYFRRPRGTWLLGGPSLIAQNFAQPGGAANETIYQFGGRFAFGGWWHKWSGSLYARPRIFSITKDSQVNPLWLQWYGGYGTEFGTFWGIRPHVTFLVGFEFYKNLVTGINASYIRDTRNAALGFSSRFIFTPRFETGGTFLYGILGGDSYRTFIRGDLTYWWNPNLSVGGGYWIDISKISQDGAVFDEKSFALEMSIKKLF